MSPTEPRTPNRASKPAWVFGQLRIARPVLDRVFEEAKAAYERDEESCGLLVGPSADVLLIDGIIPMKNRANALHALDPVAYPRTGRMYFDLDTIQFEGHIKKGLAANRPVKVLYHSHLDTGAYFSETDAAVAKMGGDEPPYDLAYLVTSVKNALVGDFRLFVWNAERADFVESSISPVDA